MQVGDKRQAGMLGVAAIGAVGFLVFQLVPKADAHAPKPVAMASAGAPGPNAAPAAVEPIPAKSTGVLLQRDPFAVTPRVHPRPSVSPEAPASEVPASQAPATASDDPAESNHVSAEKGTGLLPPAMIGAGPIVFHSGDSSSEPAEPREAGRTKPVSAKAPAGAAVPKPSLPNSAEAPKPERTKILVSLLGVVEMPVPIAMVRVGDAERTLRRGDEIAPGFRIAKITLAGITFVNRPGLTIAPGEETNL